MCVSVPGAVATASQRAQNDPAPTAPGTDTVVDARIVLGGIAPSPIQVTEAAQSLIGKPLDNDQIQAAAEAAYVKARPLDNTDFVYQWRKQMARQYTIRALEALV